MSCILPTRRGSLRLVTNQTCRSRCLCCRRVWSGSATIASSQSCSMIHRLMLLGPLPASPTNSGEPLKTMAIRLPPSPCSSNGLRFGKHVLEEQHGAVLDVREASTEPPVVAPRVVFLFNGLLSGVSTPHRREDWQACSQMSILRPSWRHLVAVFDQTVAEDDVVGVFSFDEHVGFAHSPRVIVVILPVENGFRLGCCAPLDTASAAESIPPLPQAGS